MEIKVEASEVWQRTNWFPKSGPTLHPKKAVLLLDADYSPLDLWSRFCSILNPHFWIAADQCFPDRENFVADPNLLDFVVIAVAFSLIEALVRS